MFTVVASRCGGEGEEKIKIYACWDVWVTLSQFPTPYLDGLPVYGMTGCGGRPRVRWWGSLNFQRESWLSISLPLELWRRVGASFSPPRSPTFAAVTFFRWVEIKWFICGTVNNNVGLLLSEYFNLFFLLLTMFINLWKQVVFAYEYGYCPWYLSLHTQNLSIGVTLFWSRNWEQVRSPSDITH